jgi:hypothetical protein
MNFRPSVKLVRLAGIEPTTPWFVAKYSIQLSYSRKKLIITTSATSSARQLPFYFLYYSRKPFG